MEMPTVGQRCAFEECQQLDFLPFTCFHCQCVFCKDHYAPDHHSCANVVNRVANIEEAVPFEHFPCTFPQCTVRDPVEMLCPACLKHFCLGHRHHGCIDATQAARDKEKEKWDAPRRLFEAAKVEADRQVGENLSRAIKKSGVSKTAIKVQLMRLKGKAVGLKSVPGADRVHFLIHPPLALRRKSKAVFVARQWTLGRAIDSAAELCDVPNKNNRADGPKLRLFRRSDGVPLASEMDRTLDDLIGGEVIVDGETLVLEYLADGASRPLENVELYRD